MTAGLVHPGRVVAVEAGGPRVVVPQLGGSNAYGPLPTAVPDLAVGEAVVVTSLGDTRDQLVVLGRMTGRVPEIDEIPGLAAALSAVNLRVDAVQLDQDTDQAILAGHGTRLTNVEGVNTTQNGRLGTAESALADHDTALAGHGTRLTATEGVANAAAPSTTVTTLRADTAGRATTKGDLLAATAAGVLARQPVGATGLALVADPGQSTGVAYKDLLGMPKALTGAVSPTRWVGGTVSAAPTTGTFAVGDFVTTANGHIVICTVAGSPGTWVSHTLGHGTRLTALENFEKYGWSGTGQCANGANPLISGWPTAGAGNSTRIASPNTTGQITLGKAGHWSVSLAAYSDHGSAGYSQLNMNWPGGPWNPIADWLDGRSRGSGLAGAGFLWQRTMWSGYATATQAGQPIKFYVYQVNAAATAVDYTFYLNIDYLGGA